ncbi:serine protease [Streptomyces canus]|nr:serine protease [Streptomyces canus]
MFEPREELGGQRAAARERYREASGARRTAEERLAEGVRFPDSPEAVAARAGRLVERGGVAPLAVVAGVSAEALPRHQANERIIDVANESQPLSFLPRGVRAASSIARISVRHNGRDLPLGTGFMVSPRLLLTNHHVLLDEAFAHRCFLEFNVQYTIDLALDTAVRFELDPVTFFAADDHLDYALVAVAPAADGRLAGDVFGWQQLSRQLGKVVVGEPVNIIGHPEGRPKEIAFRSNTVQARLEDFLHYTTDTEPGSSGSPVFNDQWEVVALHHCGVAKEDQQGNALRKDGQIAQPDDPDHLIDYVANEGARISSILQHLATRGPNPDPDPDGDPDGRALLAEMGPEAGLAQGVTVSVATPPVPQPPPPASSGQNAAVREAAVSPRPGLSGRGIGRGGRRHLIFVHGRRQHTHKPEDLRRGWTAGLNHGLTRAGLATINPADVWFPFYADQLNQAVTRQESAGAREARPLVLEELTAESAAELFAAESPTGSYEQLILEAAAREGMPQNGQLTVERNDRGTREGFGNFLVGPVQQALSWLAARTDVDALAIATIFRDVDIYLGNTRVREEVLTSVKALLAEIPPDGEIVLVTHSLGTVVGMDFIHQLQEQRPLHLLVTAGSPLGMDAVYRRLLATGADRRSGVNTWLNAWCPTDAVAIGCPLSGDTWGKVSDVAVVNAKGRAHSIEEYLAHPEVAEQIGQALTAP